MVLVVPLPERLGNTVGKFRDVLSKSQFENFQRVMFGLIVSHCKEHDVKSTRDAISETKCQSSINRFFTSPSWSLDNIMKRAEEIVFSNLCHDDNLEFVVIDDSDIPEDVRGMSEKLLPAEMDVQDEPQAVFLDETDSCKKERSEQFPTLVE